MPSSPERAPSVPSAPARPERDARSREERRDEPGVLASWFAFDAWRLRHADDDFVLA